MKKKNKIYNFSQEETNRLVLKRLLKQMKEFRLYSFPPAEEIDPQFIETILPKLLLPLPEVLMPLRMIQSGRARVLLNTLTRDPHLYNDEFVKAREHIFLEAQKAILSWPFLKKDLSYSLICKTGNVVDWRENLHDWLLVRTRVFRTKTRDMASVAENFISSADFGQVAWLFGSNKLSVKDKLVTFSFDGITPQNWGI